MEVQVAPRRWMRSCHVSLRRVSCFPAPSPPDAGHVCDAAPTSLLSALSPLVLRYWWRGRRGCSLGGCRLYSDSWGSGWERGDFGVGRSCPGFSGG